MNVFTNEDYLANQMRTARRLQLAGLIALIVVFIISCPISLGTNLPPAVILLAYPFLLAGFPLWSIGNNRVRRLKKTPRVDQLLNTELKGLSNKYALYHYAQLDGKFVKHLLVAPSGLIVIETRDTIGPVSCKSGVKGDTWRARSGFLDALTGQRTGIGNPSMDVQQAISFASEFLKQVRKPNVPVKGLIVFTKQSDLELESCSYPAIPLNEIKPAVKNLLGDMGGEREDSIVVDTMLTSEDRRRINAALAIPKPAAPAKPAAVQSGKAGR